MSTENLIRDLQQAYPDDPARLRGLHDRLAATAERDAALDIAYRVIDSPVGPLEMVSDGTSLIASYFCTTFDQ